MCVCVCVCDAVTCGVNSDSRWRFAAQLLVADTEQPELVSGASRRRHPVVGRRVYRQGDQRHPVSDCPVLDDVMTDGSSRRRLRWVAPRYVHASAIPRRPNIYRHWRPHAICRPTRAFWCLFTLEQRYTTSREKAKQNLKKKLKKYLRLLQ